VAVGGAWLPVGDAIGVEGPPGIGVGGVGAPGAIVGVPEGVLTGVGTGPLHSSHDQIRS